MICDVCGQSDSSRRSRPTATIPYDGGFDTGIVRIRRGKRCVGRTERHHFQAVLGTVSPQKGGAGERAQRGHGPGPARAARAGTRGGPARSCACGPGRRGALAGRHDGRPRLMSRLARRTRNRSVAAVAEASSRPLERSAKRTPIGLLGASRHPARARESGCRHRSGCRRNPRHRPPQKERSDSWPRWPSARSPFAVPDQLVSLAFAFGDLPSSARVHEHRFPRCQQGATVLSCSANRAEAHEHVSPRWYGEVGVVGQSSHEASPLAPDAVDHQRKVQQAEDRMVADQHDWPNPRHMLESEEDGIGQCAPRSQQRAQSLQLNRGRPPANRDPVAEIPWRLARSSPVGHRDTLTTDAPGRSGQLASLAGAGATR